ncbi:chorismate mutase [Streptomyces eurythermus]
MSPQRSDTHILEQKGDASISFLRSRIDELDARIIGLLQHRARLAAQVQRERIRRGGTRIAADRETEVRCRFSAGLGPAGDAVADAVLLLCRGAGDDDASRRPSDDGADRSGERRADP